MTDPLLRVRDLEVVFETDAGTVNAVNGVSFDIHEGELVGLVGESGAGKSVTGRSLLRLISSPGDIVSGEISFKGETIFDASDDATDESLTMDAFKSEIRGTEIAMIFQDPMESLNPVFTVGTQMNEIITTNRDVTTSEAREIGIEMLHEVGIPDPVSRYDEHPHQFSGGMRQRVLIAMALACEPSLIIADEPTTALDVTVEGQIIKLVDELQEKYGTSFLWITHDMGIVAEICDRVNVMYLGEIVEQAPIRQLFNDPKHPYTTALLNSIPRPDQPVDHLNPVAGEMPNPLAPPSGCYFHPRCPDARDVCTNLSPQLKEMNETDDDARASDAHRAACFKHDAFDVGYESSDPLASDGTSDAKTSEVVVTDE
ncbi:ABC transporter ATP-binding protein [Halovivax gelatinilyticus]|uniref:ABC transporter ATP-binding protein n=1 Tax=Halovivax gelatinilyticus TaxID=2961597 RepID=UPI0020CA5A83|nr:ABC transporter ATP-binding protein [Halovivax gelatinilyticus]